MHKITCDGTAFYSYFGADCKANAIILLFGKQFDSHQSHVILLEITDARLVNVSLENTTTPSEVLR